MLTGCVCVGSWVRDQPRRNPNGNGAANSDALASALRSVQGKPLQYGPPVPPHNANWSMEEEVAAENAERDKQAQQAKQGAIMMNGSGSAPGSYQKLLRHLSLLADSS